MVVIAHIGLPKDAPETWHQIAAAGYIGVPLFFVLSGIVLGYNYRDIDPRSGREVARFFIARIARVLPVYYVVLAYLALKQAAEGKGLDGLLWHALNLHTWFGDIVLSMGSFNRPGWSINVEMFFYFLFPLLMPAAMWLWRRYGARGIIAAMTVLFVVQWVLCIWFATTGWADLPPKDPMSGHRWLFRHPIPRLIEFGIGIGIALLIETKQVQRLSSRALSIIQISMIVLTMTLSVIRPFDGPSSGIWRVASYGALYTLPFAVLLLALAPGGGIVARWLSTAPMQSLGVSSFAMYLTHHPFIDHMGAVAIQESEGIVGWLMIPLLMGLCMIIGKGTYHYVEEPCRRWVLQLRPSAPPRRAR